MRRIGILVFSCLFMCTTMQQAFAHGIWLANRVDKKQIILGEGPIDNAYKPDNVKNVTAYNKNWSVLPIDKHVNRDFVTVEPTDNTAVVAISFDYGYWTKNPQGKWLNVPMNKVKDAVKSTHAIKYSVNYLGEVNKPRMVPNIPLQIVPQVDPTKLKRGDKLPVIVYKDNKPLANVPVIMDVVGNLDLTVTTDKQGKATIIVPNQGLNVIGVEIGFPLTNNKLATQEMFFTTLVFTLIPEDD
ncbi:DUF4198 domain-containing protein [Orbaceae bacterium ac157xtp]